MTRQKLLQPMISASLVLLFLVGCSAPATPTPTPIPPAATATPPPAPTATEAPLPTATPVTSGKASATPTAIRQPVTPTRAPTTVPAVSSSPCTAIGQTLKSSTDNADLVCVPAGEFLMGSADSDRDAENSEKPQHKVELDAFWIDRTEVTNAQYNQCVQAGKCTASSYASDSRYNGDTQPVVGVTWNDATTYCEWAGRRLPTEAQWEKAARGTDGRLYPWGNQMATCDYAVVAVTYDSETGCGKKTTWPVGSKPRGASPYGALDMAGNVWEWVEDRYDAEYYANSPLKNPTGPSSGSDRLLRGFGWYYDTGGVRAAYRGYADPDTPLDYFGFRCVIGALPGG